uniref:zinc finger and SCAN domain-containing protein 12-like n=1 Tax=Gasterosteus aculeatus aculeatus TaxID=481459 RepID=UPI001A9A21CA|nr:zinc finger and SCAN domain-containing protein 12-like [Gasterosteus aculeatus aculeatus]
MSSVEGLREFVNERLSAAAEEIFGVFKRSIVEYQEEIDRQRGLLDVLLKPEVRLHRIELPQSRVCKDEEVLCDQQLCLQERNPSLDQEDPDPPQIKEEQEELCSSQEGEQLEPKQEADTFTLTPTSEETDHSDDETPFLNPDRSHSDLERKPPASTCTSWLDEEIDCERFVVPEPNDNNKEPQQQILASPGDRAFLCKKCGNHFQHENDTQESDRQDQKGVKQSLTSDEPQQQSLAPPGDRAFFGKTHNEHFQHKKLHWMDQQYVCNICGRRFTDNSNLKAHIKIHSGEKPYSCITCGKTFTDKSNLKAHIRIHTGEKPYSCITCGKTFTRKSHLRSHTRIHTGEKPYPCKICERCFRNSSNLIGHIRNVHKCETL